MRKTPAVDTQGKQPSAARYQVLRAPGVLDWLERELRDQLTLSGDSDLSFECPSSGLRTPVVIARSSDGDGAVLKLFGSLWQFRTNLTALRHLNARALPVPRLLGWSARARLGPARHYLTIEARVPGREIAQVEEPARGGALEAIARSLAALHAPRRRWHGRPGLPRPGDYTTAYLPRVLERLERLAPLRPVDALRDDLRRAAAKHGTSSYALLHGRVNAGNVLVDGASAIWIDLGSAHYGEPARDLVRALHRLCAGADEARLFLASDLKGAPRGAADAIAESEPFYACDYLLLETGRQARLWTGEAPALREIVEQRLALCSDLLRGRGPRFHEVWPVIW